MTIASALTALNTDIQNARTAITNKGGTVTVDGGSSQLASDIGTITTMNGTTISITPTTSAQSFTPSSPYNAFTNVSVSAVTYNIDPNIVASNIKSGVSILGVAGNVVELKGETKTINPSTSTQTITPSAGKNGITSATVNPVTASIDANIKPENIKKDVVILSVTGTLEGGGGGGDKFRTINASGELVAPENNTLDLTGLETIPTYGMYYMFYNQQYPKNVDLSDLEVVGQYGMSYSFYGSGVESVTFPTTSFALHDYAMSYAFSGSKIENIELGTVEADAYCMQYLCDGNQYIKSFVADKFIQPTSFTPTSNYLRYCLRYAFRNSTIKKFIMKENTNYLHNFFQYAFDGSDLTFFSSQKGEYRNAAQSNTWSYAFRNCKKLKAITLCSGGGLRQATSMFQNCSNLVHAYLIGSNFSSTNSAGLNGFNGCTKLKKVDYYWTLLSSSYYAMYKTCFVGMSGLELNMFDTLLSCSNATATNSQFYGCNGIKVINLPIVQGQSGTGATNIFTGMTGVTEIHFNRNFRTTIEGLSGYSTLWGLGAGSATVYFDLMNACRFSMEPNIAYYIRTGYYDAQYGLPEIAASITMNGTTYNRSESADTDLFYAFKNGNNYVYTLTPNPCETEPVYNINEQEIGTVTSSEIFYLFFTASTSVSSRVYYTKTGIHGAIGDAAYTKDSEGGMTQVGTIILDRAG